MKIENLERQLFIESNSDSMKEVVNINACFKFVLRVKTQKKICISRQLWMEFFGIVENIIAFFIKEEKKKELIQINGANDNSWIEIMLFMPNHADGYLMTS